MLARNVARVLRKAIGAEYFASDRAHELSVAVVAAAAQKSKNSALSLVGRDYSRCHRSPRVRIMATALARRYIRELGDDKRSRRVRVKLSIPVRQPSFRRCRALSHVNHFP